MHCLSFFFLLEFDNLCLFLVSGIVKQCYTHRFLESRRSTFKLNSIKVQTFFRKNIKKKHLCHHDKNYCHFCKSNIPVTNLIAASRNRTNFQKIWACKKLDKRRESFSANSDNFFSVFYCFWMRQNFGKCYK